MKRGVRYLAPFLALPVESPLHMSLDGFDWLAAIRMLQHSGRVLGHDVEVLTAAEGPVLPGTIVRVETVERRLMLWTLEACAAYLGSRLCDRDTIMLDVDQLLFRDLSPWFKTSRADLGVLIRPGEKHAAKGWSQPLLNGVQFWRGKRRKALAAFYRQALEVARQLPDAQIQWGADTTAVRMLLEPLEVGVHERAGLTVEMIDADSVLETYSNRHQDILDAGGDLKASRPVLDFRWLRKRWMARAFAAVFPRAAC